ncbi:SDR family NAD(P)-dependent oxidoreductase [Streptomyces misionensis]
MWLITGASGGLGQLDITTNAGTLRRVLDDAISGFGRLDVVVNNAGYALAGPFEELEGTELHAQFEVGQALVVLPDMPSPPLRLPLGSDALAGNGNARSDQLEELRRFAALSISTDHTKAI